MLKRFASTDELDQTAAAEAPIRFAPHPSELAEPITLPGAPGKALATLGIATVRDLLEHLPHSHRDRRDVRLAGELGVGEEATVAVAVRNVAVKPMRDRRRKRVEARVFDESGTLVAVWFNQPWIARQLGEGTTLLLHGKLRRRGEFWVTEYEQFGNADAPVHTVGLVPVHPATEGITAARLRRLVWDHYQSMFDMVEPLPAALRVAERLPDRSAALAAAHFPDSEEDERGARRRLAFEELFLLQLAVAGRRRTRREGRRARRLAPRGAAVDRWRWSLPFELTADQVDAIADVDADLARERPMQRLLMGEVGAGKAQPLDALVLTPTGFRPMAEIRVGDSVISPSGGPTRVTGVYPQGIREVWRVRFSDGSRVECDPDHLWQVRTSAGRHRGDRPKVKSLREIAGDLFGANGGAKWHVELPAPAEIESGGRRPIDPYLLGLLLGDGGLAMRGRVRFTTGDPELVEAVRKRLPPGCRLRRERHRPYDWVVVGIRPSANHAALHRARTQDPSSLVLAYQSGASCAAIASAAGTKEHTVRHRLRAAGVKLRAPTHPPSQLARLLDDLGLMGCRSREKAVPESYLNAPVADRHALLQGLLDTDGTVKKQGAGVSFTSSSRQLATDVAWLVRSLGGRAACRVRMRARNTSWYTSIQLPEAFPPFRLTRKAARVRPRTKYAHPAKAIVAVTPAGRKPMQCISVAHPNQLYVTDHFTVTHNTVVATHAMLRAVENGAQAALMAPTETLAEQHHRTLDALLGGAIPLELLTGSTPAGRRRDLLSRLASGQLQLVVGTHALIEEPVELRDLALVVVDEQHRFGVRQRAALDAKAPEGLTPHALHMTATPIPRTLSLTAYGDLDATVLRHLPKGRHPVETYVVDRARARSRAYERIREEIAAGRQCFVVCPLVEESETLQARAATAEFERLRTTEFEGLQVELIHGQLPARRKAAAMETFAKGDADVLVATSVIEVGIDVPNATVMLIEAAERYGLSQLHQLRGRVGRGEHASLCILFGDPRLPRLEAIANERDGFRLAEIDLELRGAGDVLGTRQHGLPEFRVAQLPQDTELLVRARNRADAILLADPRLEQPEHALLREAVVSRFGSEHDPIPA
ncbi:MAG: helicase-related protein [Thermoleophilaceae bacterium]